MAIHSIGYGPSDENPEGSVDAAEAAVWLPQAGGVQSAVWGDSTSLQATPGSGDRQVQISLGVASGHGIRDVVDPQTVALAPVASGSRWDLIALRRVWGTPESKIVVIQGSEARQLPPVSTSTGDNAGRQNTPGVVADQPLWLARVTAGQSTVQELVDLRVWEGPGGAYAANALVLSYLDRVGTQIRIGDVRWERVLTSLSQPTWRRIDSTEDTGWVELTKNGGWNWARGVVRRIGATIFISIIAERQIGWSAGNGLSALPPDGQFLPDFDWYLISSHSIGEGAECFIRASDGYIGMAKNSDGDRAVTFHGSYPARRL